MMLNLEDLSRIAGFRFPRGVTVSHETIRDPVGRFGHQFAANIRRNRPVPADKWHLDEVVIGMNGRAHWLWRAVCGSASNRYPAHSACNQLFIPRLFCSSRVPIGADQDPARE